VPVLRGRAVHEGVPDGDRRPTFIKKIASGNVRGARRRSSSRTSSASRAPRVPVRCSAGRVRLQRWHRAPIQIGRLQRFATETATADGSVLCFSPRRRPRGEASRVHRAGPRRSRARRTSRSRGTRRSSSSAERSPVGSTRPGSRRTSSTPTTRSTRSSGAEARRRDPHGIEVRKRRHVKSLADEYDAVFLGLGLGADSTLGIPGESGPGSRATAWIAQMKLSPARQHKGLGRVIVIAAGTRRSTSRGRPRSSARRTWRWSTAAAPET